MNETKYYLISDNSVQWFSKIVAVTGNPKTGSFHEYYDSSQIVEILELNIGIRGKFIHNLVSREPNFYNRLIKDMTYAGWSISEKEFQQLKRIIELTPFYQEYLNLTE